MTLILGLLNLGVGLHAYVGVMTAATAGATFAASGGADLDAIRSAALGATDIWHCSGRPAVTRSIGADSAGSALVSVTVSCELADTVAIPARFSPIRVSSTVARPMQGRP